MTLDLTELLHIKLIDPARDAPTKVEAIQKLSQRLQDYELVNDDLSPTVLDREDKKPTGLPIKSLPLRFRILMQRTYLYQK